MLIHNAIAAAIRRMPCRSRGIYRVSGLICEPTTATPFWKVVWADRRGRSLVEEREEDSVSMWAALRQGGLVGCATAHCSSNSAVPTGSRPKRGRTLTDPWASRRQSRRWCGQTSCRASTATGLPSPSSWREAKEPRRAARHPFSTRALEPGGRAASSTLIPQTPTWDAASPVLHVPRATDWRAATIRPRV